MNPGTGRILLLTFPFPLRFHGFLPSRPSYLLTGPVLPVLGLTALLLVERGTALCPASAVFGDKLWLGSGLGGGGGGSLGSEAGGGTRLSVVSLRL